MFGSSARRRFAASVARPGDVRQAAETRATIPEAAGGQIGRANGAARRSVRAEALPHLPRRRRECHTTARRCPATTFAGELPQKDLAIRGSESQATSARPEATSRKRKRRMPCRRLRFRLVDLSRMAALLTRAYRPSPEGVAEAPEANVAVLPARADRQRQLRTAATIRSNRRSEAHRVVG